MSRDTYSPALRALLCALAALTLVVFGLSLGATRASADPTYSLSGTITDATGAAVGGLGLTLLDSGSNTAGGVSTNTDGTYSFTGLPADTYTLITAGGGGYTATQSTIPVPDSGGNDVTFNLVDPRFATLSGAVTAGGSPATGITIRVVDTVSGTTAGAATNGNGGYSVTLPATSDGYEFLFLDGSGTQQAIVSYDFGSGSVALSGACGLRTSAGAQQALDAGGPVSLDVVLNPDPAACDPATASPSPSPSPSPSASTSASTVKVKHHATVTSGQSVLAFTGTPGPTPTATPNAAASSSATKTFGSTKTEPDPTSASSAAPMPWWGWLLVALAFLVMLGGVSFTVVRHH